MNSLAINLLRHQFVKIHSRPKRCRLTFHRPYFQNRQHLCFYYDPIFCGSFTSSFQIVDGWCVSSDFYLSQTLLFVERSDRLRASLSPQHEQLALHSQPAHMHLYVCVTGNRLHTVVGADGIQT